MYENTLQNTMLDKLTGENVPVTLYTMNGFQIRGTVINFDIDVVLLESDGKQQMVYKHAISTIVPTRSVRLS